ncbi:PPIC-type PPIASE domain-containing protein [Polynucleobacter meluiroseus]|uniref:PPIC-type PPIASE domain-containing protein n=1 Tax=Polynucleobacter meluiroseus TaxID=1938814 RepID=A0A240E061_9BURK|nr:peptidylprolyl isomerase [Polynucleobacter meluiroseus]SNX28597.1 PPIC-type PPIASE domain-containing protein [Polynucleobacter meluiroseus]
MFDTVRKHQKILQIVLLLFIVPSFVLFGISSYSGFFDQETDLVKVNGKPITAQEVDAGAKRQAARVGGNLQIALSVPFRQAILNELLQQRILGFAVTDLRLQVGKQELISSLQRIPQIRALYRADGSFDDAGFKQLLASNGMNEEQFYAGQAFDLKIQQLVNSVARTGLATPKLADTISALYETERQVQALQINARDYLSKVKPSQEDLQAFYTANTKLFESPEYIDVEYLILKADPKEDAKVFSEKADQFANTTYDQADSLKPAADKLKLSIQSQKNVTRAGASNLSKDHPLANPKVVQALFGEESLKNKRNIEAIQISPGVFVSARVIDFHPAQALPFKTVSAEILRQVSLKDAEKLAIAAAANKYSELEKDPKNVTGFTGPTWISRNKPGNLIGPSFADVMTAKTDSLPAFVSVTNPGVGVTIYRIDQVRQPETSDTKVRQAQAQQLQSLAAQAEFAGFMGYWRNEANVKVINPLKPINSGSSGS